MSKLRMIKATVPKEGTLKDRDDIRAILKQSKVNIKNVKKRAREEKTLALLEELAGQ